MNVTRASLNPAVPCVGTERCSCDCDEGLFKTNNDVCVCLCLNSDLCVYGDELPNVTKASLRLDTGRAVLVER